MRPVLFIFFLLVTILFMGCDNDTTKVNTAPGIPQSPNPAHGAGSVNIMPELQWSCADEDGDDLTFSVYLGKTTSSINLIASDITDIFYQPETLDYSQRYYWKVRANDGSETSISQKWEFTTIAEDTPPTIPSNPIPGNGVENVFINPLLRWYCFDSDVDVISFDLYLDTDQDPQLLAEGLDTYQYQINGLSNHTTYYWKIVAKSNDLITEGPVWSFETGYGNYPPDVPNTPSPDDGDTNVSTHTDLSWECSDYEGDELSYDIYLGTESIPPLLEQDYSGLTYIPEELNPLTTYYWQIDAYDGYNHTLSPIWHFTTGVTNHPPDTPYMPRPADGSDDESVCAMLRWSCSDPDGDVLMYKVYLGTIPNLTEQDIIALGITDENIELGTLEYYTTYYWKITAHDGELTTTSPVWSFTTEISSK